MAEKFSCLTPRVHLWTSISDLMDLTMWHSKTCWLLRINVTSSLINREMAQNRVGNMAIWVAPIRVYHYLIWRNQMPSVVPFIFIHVCYRFGWLAPNHGNDIFGTLKRNEGPVMCEPGCKTFLLNPNVFISRGTLSEGDPIPCHSWNPFSNKSLRFWLYTIYVEREMQAFC